MKEMIYETDLISVGGSIELRDKVSFGILYKKYDAVMKYEGAEIPVIYRKYPKGNGIIEYGQIEKLDDKTKNIVKNINSKLTYNYENDVQGLRYKHNRRAMFRLLGLLFQAISLILGIIFMARIVKGAPYIPCVSMAIFCGLFSFFIAYITDRIIRD